MAQADALGNILDDTARFRDICSGVSVFSFVDEWWKDQSGSDETQDVGGRQPQAAGVPYDGVANEEHWGIVKLDRTPKQAYRIVQKVFTAVPAGRDQRE